MPLIYHVTTALEWNAAKQKGMYAAASLHKEGFIHCSQEQQVSAVLERYFEGMAGLVKLVIDTDKLTSRYILEWSPSVQDTFPHIYGPVNIDAVTEIVSI